MSQQRQLPRKKTISSFDFEEGRILSDKFEVVAKLGGGWEGEVYMVKELSTGIERAAKFFLPQRNINNKALKFYAKKLHKLRNCSIVIQYLTQDTIIFEDHKISYLVSDYVEGSPLKLFLSEQKSKRLSPFQALHLLHALAKGIEEIHHLKEYHGDLHSDNIIVQRFGLGFQLKVIDFFHYGPANSRNIRGDVLDLVKIFHEAVGGAKHYANQPGPVKQICCGLKKNLIFKKFKTAGQLRGFLENMSWN